mgnify:CR=1 FL=1
MIGRLLRKYPTTGQLGLAGFIAWSSDTTLQLLTDKPFDYNRNLRFATTFFLVQGPSNLVWLRWLDKRNWSPAKCVFVDMFLFYPVQLSCIAAVSESLKLYVTKETNRNELNERLNDIPGLITDSLFYWIPVSYIYFAYLSLAYRLVAINCASYIFNIYISYVIN